MHIFSCRRTTSKTTNSVSKNAPSSPSSANAALDYFFYASSDFGSRRWRTPLP
jgi:hypothetical protein